MPVQGGLLGLLLLLRPLLRQRIPQEPLYWLGLTLSILTTPMLIGLPLFAVLYAILLLLTVAAAWRSSPRCC